MFRITRTSLACAFAAVALTLVAATAKAQMTCDQCDPYWSHCSDPCIRCRPGEEPGTCRGAGVTTTCGDDRVLADSCLRDGCAPFFAVVSRQNVGSYGEALFGWKFSGGQYWPQFACEHHMVDWVTERDLNQCNQNPYWWDRTYCDDWVDYRSDYHDSYQNCCSYPFYCNDYHSCS